MKFIIRFIIIPILLFLLVSPPPSIAQEKDSWLKLDTRYTVLMYQSEKDLHRFDREIRYKPTKEILKRLRSGSQDRTPHDALKFKIDGMFERVQEILDMKGKVSRVAIRIYPDKKALREIYTKLTRQKCRVRSWYMFQYKSIFATCKDIHEGILAHEMAHHVIDHYLNVRPPRATAEILARYVDKHLLY